MICETARAGQFVLYQALLLEVVVDLAPEADDLLVQLGDPLLQYAGLGRAARAAGPELLVLDAKGLLRQFQIFRRKRGEPRRGGDRAQPVALGDQARALRQKSQNLAGQTPFGRSGLTGRKLDQHLDHARSELGLSDRRQHQHSERR